MKRTYNTPVIRLSRFSRENILTASANPEAYNKLLEEKNINANNITTYDNILVF